MQWVLRNARVHAADRALRTAAGFAHGAGRATPVHRAQVGRWESGAVEVTYDLVRRYETVLGLPEGQLLCAIDYFSRDEDYVRPGPALPPPGTPDVDDTLDLIERARSTERMTGHDWDVLSGNIGRLPGAVIRAGDWEALIRRCIAEMGTSLHLEFALRDEAVARFAGHPRSGGVVARIADEALSNPAAQIYADFVALIQYTDDPACHAVVLKHLREPVNDDALWTTVFVMTTLLRRGVVPPDLARQAGGLALDLLRDPAASFRVQRAAANIVRALDLPGRDRLVFGLTPAARRFAASIFLEGRALDREAHATVSKRVRRALAHDPATSDASDTVLAQLLASSLGQAHEESRSHALAILMLSPQGPIVGHAYAAELARAHAAGDRVASHECLSVLSWLNQPEDLALPTDLVCSLGTDPEIASAAGISVGNTAEPAGPEHEARDARLAGAAVELARSMSRQASRPASQPGSHGSADAELRTLRYRWRGLAYALAMRGRYDLLRDVLQAPPADGPGAGVARSALRWWLDLPVHLQPLAAVTRGATHGGTTGQGTADTGAAGKGTTREGEPGRERR